MLAGLVLGVLVTSGCKLPGGGQGAGLASALGGLVLTLAAALVGGRPPGAGVASVPGAATASGAATPGVGLATPGSVLGAPTQPGGGGLPLSEPGTDATVPSSRAYRVLASSFGPQAIAGRTVEDGNSTLSREERGVALPSRRALGQWVAVRHNGNLVYAPVIDVGPWFTDDAYWESGAQPRAEREKGATKSGTLDFGQRSSNLKVNGAAIDLTWQTWKDLGVQSTSVMDEVEWWFVDPTEGARWLAARTGGATVA